MEDSAKPFLLRYRNELAGFVIIDNKGADASTDFIMAQSFILRRFKGAGVGKYIVKQCFDLFKGNWEVMVIPNNTGAYEFWMHCIQEYTTGKFTEIF